MNFVAIDVETANNDVGSICQIGLAKYANGRLIDTYCTHINPQSAFDYHNIKIHGITSDMVEDAPVIIDAYDDILAFIDNHIVVSYTLFDQRAMNRCFSYYQLIMPEWPWIDATVLVRQTNQRFAIRGYNLANVCKAWNYHFAHHDALEDAKACGFITTTILREDGSSIYDWLKGSPRNRGYSSKKNQPRTSHKNLLSSHYSNNNHFNNNSLNNTYFNHKSYPTISAKQGDKAGQYAGLNICFTGNLSISRETIIEIAAKHGFNVKAGASKKLDYLVIGTHDLTILNGHEKSSKQRKVETLIASGVEIKIIEEHTFFELVGLN